MRAEAFLMPGPWSDLRAAASRYESLGFDALGMPEITSDPIMSLAQVAPSTEKIALRTAILVCFPRSPMVVAYQAWDLHVNSGGRFGLGLGTQVRGHNVRRFSVPWEKPAARLTEYVEALRAIWRCWEKGERLSYEGEHYQLSLMTPEFSPAPSGLPPIPVYTAAVRPAMMRVAARVSDGVRLHGFCTGRYLREVALANIESALEERGKPRSEFEVCGGGFVATGADEAAVARALETVRYRVAFYGSTPAYRPVLSLHGWDDLGDELHAMSRRGQWSEMAARVPDDVVAEFSVSGTFDVIGDRIAQRFGGLTDSIELGFFDASDEGAVREAVQDVRRIPAKFTGTAGW